MKINSTIEQWLAGSGARIAETAAGEMENDEPKYPFLVYSDIESHDGADECNFYARHSLYLYYYTESKTDDAIKNWLKAQNIKFSSDKTYLDDDDVYECEYVINEEIFTKEGEA